MKVNTRCPNPSYSPNTSTQAPGRVGSKRADSKEHSTYDADYQRRMGTRIDHSTPRTGKQSTRKKPTGTNNEEGVDGKSELSKETCPALIDADLMEEWYEPKH
jgi:hypothetical protein